ncbi:hypothetical protein TVAG_167110 [Trichomonas vaginalis G3]|uniref:Uncharacterized protein n=2 Tax=Trichomonas vaginalis (strain ATCC PRA-98 / G3) TaxID=412133 RepID=A2DEB8_TRIV3|nr:hypothetical protein TVAG_167110 [Trichomonas vaginalis G3]|eukprot:XP_001582322.1 hypothetical protein [Trichomonas vaginalis G3]
MHIAAEHDSIEVLNELILHRIDIDAKANNGYTALHFGVANNHLRVVKFLYCNNADLNKEAPGVGKATNLIKDEEIKEYFKNVSIFQKIQHYFKENNTFELLQIFAENPKMINFRGNSYLTPLILSVFNKNLPIANYLIKNGADMNACDKTGNTALHYAVVSNYMSLVHLIFLSGGNIDRANPITQETPRAMLQSLGITYSRDKPTLKEDKFMEICKAIESHNSAKAMELLVTSDRIFDITDKKGNNLLHLAAAEGLHEVVLFIATDKLHDMNIQNKDKNTALMIAYQKYTSINNNKDLWKVNPRNMNYMLVMKSLAYCNADLAELDTLMKHAIESGASEMNLILFLMDICHQYNHRKLPSGETFFMYAVRLGNLEAVCNMHPYGFDPADRNPTTGMTYLHYAYVHKNKIFLHMFQNLMLDDESDNLGVTATEVNKFINKCDLTRYNHIKLSNETVFDFYRAYAMQDTKRISSMLFLHKKLHRSCYANELHALHLVAMLDDYPLIDTCLEAEKESDCRDMHDMPPLFYCIKSGKLDTAKYMVSKKCKLTVKGPKGRNALHFAVLSCHQPTIDWVISKDIDLLAMDHNKRSCLHYMVIKCSTKVLKDTLKGKFFCVDVNDKDNRTPLSIACEMGNYDAVDFLVSNFDAFIDACDVKGNSPLLYAAANGHADIVLYLLKHNPQKLLNNMGQSALHLTNSVEVLNIFIQMNANTNLLDLRNRTPLHYNAARGNTKLIEVLLENGADCNIRDKEGFTPLEVAISCRQLEAARLLKTTGRDTLSLPLHAAVLSDNLQIVKECVAEDPARINQKDAFGRSAILLTENNKSADILKFLISKGADINAVNEEGSNIAHLVAYKLNLPLIDAIPQEIVNKRERKKNNSPLHLVLQRLLDSEAKSEDYDEELEYQHNNTDDPNGIDQTFERKPRRERLALVHIAVNSLLKKGADKTAMNSKYTTPLHMAACVDDWKLTELVMDKFMLDTLDQQDRTPLYIAVSMKNEEAAITLLEHGCGILGGPQGKAPPPFVAIQNGMCRTLEMMFKMGLEYGLTYKGETMMDAAAHQKVSEVSDVIKKYKGYKAKPKVKEINSDDGNRSQRRKSRHLRKDSIDPAIKEARLREEQRKKEEEQMKLQQQERAQLNQIQIQDSESSSSSDSTTSAPPPRKRKWSESSNKSYDYSDLSSNSES